MRISNPVWKSSPGLKKIFEVLNSRVRFIGGCVRDSLIARPVSDIDLACEYTPEKVTEILKENGFTVIPTGIDFGTVTVVLKNDLFPFAEITTLRRDVKNDGRRPDVVFTESWEEDAQRRDFTFNALSADFDGTVHDPCGGLEDLKFGRIRFIGDPVRRIREDYLRILRYFRFLALFSARCADPEILAVCRAESGGLARISLDRTRQELFKLVKAPNAICGLSAMAEAGLLEMYFPKADLDAFERFVSFRPRAEETFRFLALMPLTAEAAGRFAALWKLSGKEKKKMAYIAGYPREKEPATYTKNDIFRLAVYFMETDAETALALFEAKEPGRGWQGLKERLSEVVILPFAFSGGDVAGRVPEKQIRDILARVYEYWLSENGRPLRDELLEYAEKIISSRNPD